MFGTKKLEWCGYPMVKKMEDMFIHDGIKATLMHSIARQKSKPEVSLHDVIK